MYDTCIESQLQWKSVLCWVRNRVSEEAAHLTPDGWIASRK